MPNQERDIISEREKELEKELNSEVKEFSSKIEKYGKNALIVAGGVFVAYQTFKLFSGKKSKKSANYYEEYAEDESYEKQVPRRIIVRESKKSPGIIDHIKAELAEFLLELAKEKIVSFLKQLEQNTIANNEQGKKDITED